MYFWVKIVISSFFSDVFFMFLGGHVIFYVWLSFLFLLHFITFNFLFVFFCYLFYGTVVFIVGQIG